MGSCGNKPYRKGNHVSLESRPHIKLVLLSMAVGFAVAVLEIALRFLPVYSGTRALPVSATAPVFRFTPSRTITYSSGWNFRNANTVSANNAGFMSLLDYRREESRPVLALIGDSYIEGLVVPQTETLGRRLHAMLARGRRV